eukprot:gene10758-11957_t
MQRESKLSWSSSTFQNVSLLLSTSILQKVVVFFLNQFILSRCSPELLGRVSVQLELWLSMCLFLSRESIRIACLRHVVRSGEDWQAVVNVSWLACPIALLVAAALLVVWFWMPHLIYPLSPSTPSRNDYSDVLFLFYTIAALIESCGEPWVNVCQCAFFLQPRLIAESVALVVKSIVLFLTYIVLDYRELSFGLAQVAYAVCLLLVHIIVAMRGLPGQLQRQNLPPLSTFSFVPHLWRVRASNLLWGTYHSLARTIRGVAGGLLLKQALTEADKIALAFFSPPNEQGLYALANNYGSLLARLVFLPVEDAGRLTFHKLAALMRHELSPSSLPSSTTTITSMRSNGNFIALFQQLEQLLRLMVVIGSLIVLFGPPYLPLLLRRVLPGAWLTTQDHLNRLLSFYCVYLSTLAVNGVTEAFVQSVSPLRGLPGLTTGLFLSTAMFLLSIFYTVRLLGSLGVVISNMVGMIVRIGWNLNTIERWYADPILLLEEEKNIERKKEKSPDHLFLSSVLPLKIYLLVTCCSMLSVQSSYLAFAQGEDKLSREAFHWIVGVVTGIVYLWQSFYFLSIPQREALLSLIARFVSRSKAKET